MSSRGSTPLVVVLFAGLLWPGALAAQVTQTVDFEGLPYGSALDQAYQSIGLSIPGARIDTVPRSEGSRHVARMVNPNQGQPPILTLLFAAPQRYVTFVAGSSAPGRAFVRGTVIAYDAANNQVAQFTQERVSKDSVATQFGVRTAQPSIRRVVLQFVVSNATVSGGVGSNLDVAVDHLTFWGLAPPQHHVPDLSGMTLAQAVARLADSGLLLKDEPNRPKLPGPGTVSDQLPKPGAPAAAGDSVSVTLVYVDKNGKKPRPLTHVPDLSNLTRQQAVRSLADSGLKPGKVGAILGPGKVGTVFRQAPPPGDTITRGRTVDFILYRAAPPESIHVPDLYGHTRQQADSILSAAQLALGDVAVAPGPAMPGTIFNQKPARGQPAKRGERVSVVIASEPPPPIIDWPWWVWVALGAGGVAGATTGARHWRRRLQRRRLKAVLKSDSLEWQDSGSPEPGRRAAELRFRVTLDVDDDDRAGSP